MKKIFLIFLFLFCPSIYAQNKTVILNWAPATDDTTPTLNLIYEVRQSSFSDIDSVNDAEINGKIILNYSVDTQMITIYNLNSNLIYYFNVIVKDEANNKATYKMIRISPSKGKPPKTK